MQSKLLTEFVPIAYCRILLDNTGVHFSDSFCTMLHDGTVSVEQPFVSEPIWNAAVTFARKELASGLSQDDLLFVAGRSPEFDAANSLLQKGVPLEKITFTSPVLKTADAPATRDRTAT
jgi:hypothetical protein